MPGWGRRSGAGGVERGGGGGVERNHAEGVGDHVMELARNPGPLFVGREPAVLVTLTLEPCGPVLQLSDVGAPCPKVVSNEPGRDEEQAGDGDGERPRVTGDAKNNEARDEKEAGGDQEN